MVKEKLRRCLRACSDARGDLMVEAMIVVVIAVFVLFTILEMSFFLYQQVNTVITANDVATRMAQTYRFVDSDYLIGFVTPEEITSVSQYRYLSSSASAEFLSSAQQKSAILAEYRLAKTSLLAKKGVSDTQVKLVRDTMGRRHLEVTVTATYEVPLLAFLRYFKLDSAISDDGTYTMSTTAYADCPDMIDYISTINFAKTAMGDTYSLDAIEFLKKAISAKASLTKKNVKLEKHRG